MNLGITGQRPYSASVRPEERQYGMTKTHAGVDHYFGRGANTLITGMAQGPDQWAAMAALRNRMELVAALPFPAEHQARRWSDDAREQYVSLLACAARTWTAYPTFEFAGYSLRNQYLVDHADVMLIVTNGRTQGGTWDCIMRVALANKPGAVVHTKRRRVTEFVTAEGLAAALELDVDLLLGRAAA
jgi:hypothetical protein